MDPRHVDIFNAFMAESINRTDAADGTKKSLLRKVIVAGRPLLKKKKASELALALLNDVMMTDEEFACATRCSDEWSEADDLASEALGVTKTEFCSDRCWGRTRACEARCRATFDEFEIDDADVTNVAFGVTKRGACLNTCSSRR